MSAAQAVSGKPTRAEIEDLAALINTLMLHDRVEIIGSRAVWERYASDFPLIEYLWHSGCLSVSELSDAEIEKIAAVAQKHLAAVIGLKDASAFEPLLGNAYLSRLCYSTSHGNPDGDVDLQMGRDWVITAPPGVDLDLLFDRDNLYAKSTMFFVRTFFYVAYVDIRDMDFSADSIRASLVAEISRQQMSFQNQLLKELQIRFDEDIYSPKLQGWLSPFAAVVFQRSQGRTSNIIDEIQRLRDEVQPSRDRLIELEERFKYGPPNNSLEESRKAKAEFIEALNELTRSYTAPMQRIERKEFLTFGAAAANVALQPTSVSSWQKFFASFPIHPLNSRLAKRPFVEVHQLFSGLPAPQALLRRVEALFGKDVLRK